MRSAAGLCLILLVLWTLLAYIAVPLPISDPFFAWLRRQWLFEGVAGLACLSVICLAASPRCRRAAGPSSWWSLWWLFLAWAAASLSYSIDRGVSWRAWLSFAALGLLALAAGQLAAGPSEQRTWARFLGAVAVVVSLEGLFQYFGVFSATLSAYDRLRETGELTIHGWGGGVIRDFLIRKRIFSVFGWPNLFAGFLLLMVPLAIGLSRASAGRGERRVWAGCAALLAACLALTLSMGGWIAAIVTAGLAWWMKRDGSEERTRRGRRWTLGHILAASLALSAALLIGAAIAAKRARPFIRASVSSRAVYVQGALNVLRAHPMRGTGIGTYGLAYRRLMPLEASEGQHSAMHAHNTLLEFGAELGLPGLLLFVIFLAAVGRLISRPLRAGWSGQGSAALSWGLAAGLLGFFIHSLIEQTFMELVTAPFWWIALGLLTAAESGPEVDPRPLRPLSRWLQAGAAALIAAAVTRLVIADSYAVRAALGDLTGRPEQASSLLRQAQRWDPMSSRYPLETGERALRQAQRAAPAGRYAWLQTARGQLEHAARLSPWLGQAWLKLGIALRALGQLDAAAQVLTKASECHPNSRLSLQLRAELLTALGRHRELLPIARQFQTLEPGRPDGWLWEGLAWETAEESANAYRAYRKAVAVSPGYYPALFRLASLARRLGRQADALEHYQAFLQAAPRQDQAAIREAEQFLSLLDIKNHKSP